MSECLSVLRHVRIRIRGYTAGSILPQRNWCCTCQLSNVTTESTFTFFIFHILCDIFAVFVTLHHNITFESLLFRLLYMPTLNYTMNNVSHYEHLDT